ncbi:MAG: hypothetical protein R2883_00250 [Caldisericia bacterium]
MITIVQLISGICDVCHLGAGFPNLGDITTEDRMGRLNNVISGSEPPFFQTYTGARFEASRHLVSQQW